MAAHMDRVWDLIELSKAFRVWGWVCIERVG